MYFYSFVYFAACLEFSQHIAANSFCEQCRCVFEEVTPLIDCSQKDFAEAVWTIPEERLNERLVDIDYEENQITTIPIIPSIPVERLSFRKNKILSIADGAFENLSFLAYLDLGFNNLENVTQNTFMGPQRPNQGNPSPILGLDLSFNKITILPRTAFEYLVNLEEIVLSGNPLQIVDNRPTATAIGSLTRLVQLDIAYTGTETFQRNFFKGLPNLKKLNLAGNKFQIVPTEIIYNGENLLELILDDNPIEELRSHSFNGMGALVSLSLSNMSSLSAIHEAAFSSLRSLEVLRLESNKMLGFIDPDAFVDFQYPMVLKELYLSNNFLRYLPRGMLPELKDLQNTSLQLLKVEGNQWECDCHNMWLIDILKSEKYAENAKTGHCTRPSMLKGVTFANLKKEDLPCEHEDDYDPTKINFGLPNPKKTGANKKPLFLILATGSVLTILGSVAFVTILHLKRNQKISYSRLAGFKIHFRRRRGTIEEEIRTTSTTLDNTVYRENPTTMPI